MRKIIKITKIVREDIGQLKRSEHSDRMWRILKEGQSTVSTELGKLVEVGDRLDGAN